MATSLHTRRVISKRYQLLDKQLRHRVMKNATARLNCSVTGSARESVCFVDEVSVSPKCRYVSQTRKMKNSYKNINIHIVKKLEWCVQTHENNEGKTVHQL